MTAPRWEFGVEPLPQTVRLAAVMRRVTSAALALEGEEPGIEGLIERLEQAERELAARLPADLSPRIGPEPADDQRVYVQHARHVGAYNPGFPEYTITVDGPRANGTVHFPLAFEGPPGVVHGGFLAVFFDCVIQHHNCEVGVAGKTTDLSLQFRRPTPARRDLTFEIQRTADPRRITSQASLALEGKVLCRVTMEAVAGDRTNLPAVSPRRPAR